MDAVNKIPASYIVAETKINPQSMQGFMRNAKNITDWEKEWRTRNLNETLTDIEKVPEVSAMMCRKANEDTTTAEFNKNNIIYVDGFFNHATISVAFVNVSKEFVFDITAMDSVGQINASEVSDDELSFWVNPCVMDEEHAAVFFGKEVTRAGQVIKNTKEFLEKNSKATPHELYHASRRLVPVVAQVHAMVTATVYDWRNVIFRGSQFTKKDEMRYVLLDLARKFKMKYPTFFNDFVLENENGDHFGLDTLGSEDDAWRKYRIAVNANI